MTRVIILNILVQLVLNFPKFPIFRSPDFKQTSVSWLILVNPDEDRKFDAGQNELKRVIDNREIEPCKFQCITLWLKIIIWYDSYFIFSWDKDCIKHNQWWQSNEKEYWILDDGSW